MSAHREVARPAVKSAGGFTVAELAFVVLLISLLLSVTVIASFYAARGTRAKSGAEILKHEIKRVYALADSGKKTNGERDRYRIEFHGTGESPPNAYRVLVQTFDGGSWSWGIVEPEKGAAVKTLGGGWVSPFGSGGVEIADLSGMDRVAAIGGESNYGITFVSVGSIVTTGPPVGVSGDKTITLDSGGSRRVITVSEYGSVSD